MSAANLTPLEDDEQAQFVSWCEAQDLKLTAVPNSTYTNSHKQKAKNRRLGLRAGFPDLIVLISPHQSRDGEGYLLPIEMKRTKGGVVSDAQKTWLEAINGLGTHNVQAYVAKGAREAENIVRHYLKPSSPF